MGGKGPARESGMTPEKKKNTAQELPGKAVSSQKDGGREHRAVFQEQKQHLAFSFILKLH